MKSRLLIPIENPDFAANPDRVLNVWYESLLETGVENKIYFKVPETLHKRQESIVVYLTKKTSSEDIEKCLTMFADTCPADLLSPTPMPSAAFLTRGITMAPELQNINNFIAYSGIDTEISYNEWVASTFELALELAYHDISISNREHISPKNLKPLTEKYFEQIVKLSGINPQTMVANSLGGELPLWAKRLQEKNV